MVGVSPPSTTNSVPVTADARGDETKQMQLATSSGVRNRPSGVLAAVSSATSLGLDPFIDATCWAIPSAPNHIGVAVNPGDTVTTRIPWLANSEATALPTLSRGALDALYAAASAAGKRLLTDVTFTITPTRSFICGIAACMTRTAAMRFRSSVL